MKINELDNIAVLANASIFRKFDYNRVHKIFYPENEEEIKKALEFAKKNNLTVSSKGGGSGLSGACTGGNYDRIFISSHRLKQIYNIDFLEGSVWVESGLTPDEINTKLRKYNMQFKVSPSSREMATVGGLISTDGGGNDAWINGTTRDNILAAEVYDQNGEKFIVTNSGSYSKENIILNGKLKDVEPTLNDLASSHGTLGFIGRIKIKISKIDEIKDPTYGLIFFNNLNDFGRAIVYLIGQKTVLHYSEAISYISPEMKDKTKYPVLIQKFPQKELKKIKNVGGSFEILNEKKFNYMYDLRRSLPKTNPQKGIQFAVFEGYGFTEKELKQYGDIQEEIHALIRNHGFEPFLKYGHAPSKWYSDNNEPKFGFIQHSREVPQRKLTGQEILNTIIAIVDLCKRLNLTSKPEHKWWMLEEKRKRLREITDILGKKFNPWIFEESIENLTNFVL